MKRNSTYSFMLLVVLALIFSCAQGWSSEIIREPLARSISGTVTPFLAAGGLSLLSDKHEFTQCAKALGATCLATEVLKHAVGEKRPNSDSRTSFPSGHAAAAFAMATVLSDYRPEYKWPAYIAASAIGYSRVEAGSHYWRDVVGGAALGYFVGKHFTSDHVMVSPQGVGYQWKW